MTPNRSAPCLSLFVFLLVLFGSGCETMDFLGQESTTGQEGAASSREAGSTTEPGGFFPVSTAEVKEKAAAAIGEGVLAGDIEISRISQGRESTLTPEKRHPVSFVAEDAASGRRFSMSARYPNETGPYEVKVGSQLTGDAAADLEDMERRRLKTYD